MKTNILSSLIIVCPVFLSAQINEASGQTDTMPSTNDQYEHGSLMTASNAQATQVTPVPPPCGMVAWWSGDGNALDLAGTNDGILNNGATYTQGKVGQAYFFDGIDDQFEATTEGLPIGDSDRTIEFWVLIDSFNRPQ